MRIDGGKYGSVRGWMTDVGMDRGMGLTTVTQ